MDTIDPTKTHVAREYKHSSPPISCRFDPSGKYVFFGAQDLGVWRWEWAGDQTVELTGHESWVRALSFTPDGTTLLTGGYDGRLIWWPATADKPEPIRVVETEHGWIRAVAVNPEGTRIATAGNDHLVKLWDAATGKLMRELASHERFVYNVAFHPNGKALVSGDLMGQLVHWNVETGEAVRTFKAESLHKYDKTFKADIGGLRGLTFDRSGTRLAGCGITNVTNAFAGVGNPIVVEFDWDSVEETIQHLSKDKLRGVAWNVALHPDGIVIGISGGGGGGFLLFWKPDQEHEFHKFKLPNMARDLDLAADGLHVVTAHYDRRLRVCKMASKT